MLSLPTNDYNLPQMLKKMKKAKKVKDTMRSTEMELIPFVVQRRVRCN